MTQTGQGLTVSIGEIAFNLAAEGSAEIDVEDHYRPFVVSAAEGVPLTVEWNDPPSLDGASRVFSMERLCCVFHTDRYSFLTTPNEPPFERIVRMERDFSSGRISITKSPGSLNLHDWWENNRRRYPLAHPIGQLLMVNILPRRGGLLMHGCGVVYGGRGYVFVGPSEGGKTTMARIWDKVQGAEVLSEEKVICRRVNGTYRVFGTPWYGEDGYVSAASAPLAGFFCLTKSDTNKVEKINSRDAVSSLLPRCAYPYWDAGGISATLGFMSELLDDVSLQRLHFTPDQKAVDTVLASAQ